jgi:hypothetical protein
MAIAWNLDRFTVPVGLLANVVAGVARLAKFDILDDQPVLLLFLLVFD